MGLATWAREHALMLPTKLPKLPRSSNAQVTSVAFIGNGYLRRLGTNGASV